RAVSHLGRSRCSSGGSGSAVITRCPPLMRGEKMISGVEDIDQVAGGVLAGEAEEDLLEAALPFLQVATEIRHGAVGLDLPVHDDREPVAERLGHLKRVGGEDDGVAAPRVLAEEVLEDAR